MPHPVARFPLISRCAKALCGLLAACALLTLPACSPPKPDLVAPRVLVAPYNTTSGEVLWAVLPLRNESGTTAVDAFLITDKLIAASEQIRGVRVVPLSRVLHAMNALKIPQVTNPADAKKIADALGADAILTGSITAYDPYTPTLGFALGLFGASEGFTAPGRTPSTPQALTARTTESPERVRDLSKPLSTASAIFDGKSHETQLQVRQFAMGRSDDTSALAWRRYIASADLFGEFASYQILDDLLRSEWLRSGTPAPGSQAP